MRNLHQILLQEYGVEAQHLFRDWGRLQLRASNYRNHRIFTLRCLHKDLIPVSIKLKSTLKTAKASKILRNTEKDLLQARVKAINSILDNVSKQTEECRSQLKSIISAQRLRECQGFVDKLGEIRFTKVKQRQLNKHNMLLNKKEGNITRATNINSNNLASQASSQASASLPPREGSNVYQAGSQVGSSQATALLPPGEGSSISQATALLPIGEGSSSSQATALLPPSEGSNSSQAIARLPPGKGSNSYQATAHLPPREGSSSPQADQSSNQARSGRQGYRQSTRHRAPQASHENSAISQEDNITTTPPVGFPKGLLMKNLTLSWSLTFPTNL